MLPKEKYPKIFFILVLACYFFFGLHHLTEFVSFDEHYWLYNPEDDRIHQYWDAISHGDWEDTRINDKPGITLAYVSGIGILFEKNPENQVKFRDGTIKIFDPQKTKELNFLYRLPILVLTGLFSVYFFWIIRKITANEWLSLLGVTLTYLSPVILGISQIVNPDSLFWIFGFASFLTYIASLKHPDKKYIWLTMLFFGLSMASKYVAIIFIPFFLFLLLSHYLFLSKDISVATKRIKRDCLAYFAIIGGGLLLFSLMMPAVFVEPKIFYESTIGFSGMAPVFLLCIFVVVALLLDGHFFQNRWFLASLSKLQPLRIWAPRIISAILLLTFLFILLNWMLRHRLLDLTDIPFDLKRKPEFGELPYLQRFILEGVPLVFASVPISLFAILYLWIRNIFGKIRYEYLSFVLTSFILIFYIAVIQEGLLLTIRYSIILYPISALLAALAIYEFFANNQSESKTVRRVTAGIFSISLLVYTASSVEQLKIFSERDLRVFYNFHRFVFFLLVIGLVAGLAGLIMAMLNWKKLRQAEFVKITMGLVLLSLISIWQISPYYFSYTNSFLPKKYIITGGWGYGGYEAAQYMNQKTNAENLTVWTDSYGFCEFFVGKCIHKTKIRTEQYPIDYFYSTLQNQLRPQFIGPKYKESGKPEWNLEIDGRYKNYVRIFRAEMVESNRTNDDE